MGFNSNRDSDSSQRGFLSKVLKSGQSDRTRHRNTINSEAVVTKQDAPVTAAPMFESAVRQLDKNGYNIFNIEECADIYIAFPNETVDFDAPDEMNFVRAEPDLFVGGSKSIDLPMAPRSSLHAGAEVEDYDQPADIFTGARRRPQYEEVDFNQITFKKKSTVEEPTAEIMSAQVQLKLVSSKAASAMAAPVAPMNVVDAEDAPAMTEIPENVPSFKVMSSRDAMMAMTSCAEALPTTNFIEGSDFIGEPIDAATDFDHIEVEEAPMECTTEEPIEIGAPAVMDVSEEPVEIQEFDESEHFEVSAEEVREPEIRSIGGLRTSPLEEEPKVMEAEVAEVEAEAVEGEVEYFESDLDADEEFNLPEPVPYPVGEYKEVIEDLIIESAMVMFFESVASAAEYSGEAPMESPEAAQPIVSSTDVPQSLYLEGEEPNCVSAITDRAVEPTSQVAAPMSIGQVATSAVAVSMVSAVPTIPLLCLPCEIEENGESTIASEDVEEIAGVMIRDEIPTGPVEVLDDVADIMLMTVPELAKAKFEAEDMPADADADIPEDGMEKYDCIFRKRRKVCS